MPIKNALVVADLPKTGLGNMLLTWAHAYVYSWKYKLPLVTLGWKQVRIGPWLRGEARKRWYGSSFQNDSLFKRIIARFKLSTRQIIDEPTLSHEPESDRVYRFSKFPLGPDYFSELRDHRDLVASALTEKIRHSELEKLRRLPAPEIAIHVRRGDFAIVSRRLVQEGKAPLLCPIEYYVAALESIRQCFDEPLTAIVFSDGTDAELDSLLRMPNISRAKPQSDVVDLLLMSRANIIVTSPRSTFSYWGVFLSNAHAIHKPWPGFKGCRKASSEYSEGSIEDFSGKFRKI